MKLAEALNHLTRRFPRHAARLESMRLDQVQDIIEQSRLDLKAWELLAHSARAKERWGSFDRLTVAELRQLKITPEVVAAMPDNVLRKRANMGGATATREMINAELLKRVHKNAYNGLKPDGEQ